MKILIVEDDQSVSQFIKEGFESEGFIVDTAYDGQNGSYKARTGTYDIIILDYSLPYKNGIEVCKEIREVGSSVPIIFLSVNAETKNKIEAFGKGSDDYLTKPFSFDELKARVQALLRRPKMIESSIIKCGEISLDTQNKLAYRDKDLINLTIKEYNLLEYLMRNRGAIVSRSMIMEHVWSAESDPLSNTIETHILNIRKKINSKNKDLIRNLPGRGYSMQM